jgi:hypothetical protein
MPAPVALSRSLEAQPLQPFTYADALHRGLTRWGLSQLVERGEVVRVMRDVYVPAGVPDGIALRAAAAALIAPPHAVLVDRTAAWVWAGDAMRPWALDEPPRLDLFVLRGHKRITRAEAGGGERDLSPRDITQVNGMAVTTPVRTSVDLACGSPPYDAIAALDALSRAAGLTAFELMAELPRHRGRRGVVQARRLVPLVDSRSESSGESFTRLAIHDAGLPRPTPQYWVYVRGIPTFRLDLAYPRHKICVEYDGQEHHSSESDRLGDQRRRAWLREHGWEVLVVTKDAFAGAALDHWLGQLRAALADRSTRR